MRKILIQINLYFVIKIWQMRNVSTQNREKLFFPFLLYFSPTITQSFIMRFMSMSNVYTRHDLRTGFQRKLSCKPLTGLTD